MASRRSPARHGAWVLSDEVYRGAELDGEETPSMWGRHERVIVTERTVEGLRATGVEDWLDRRAAIVGRVDLVVPRLHDDRARRVQRSPGASGAGSVAPAGNPRRTRRIVRENLPLIERWLREHAPMFSWIPPRGGSDRLRSLQLRHQLDRAGDAAARREERPGCSWRSLRHGRISAPRIRRAARLSAPGSRPPSRPLGFADPFRVPLRTGGRGRDCPHFMAAILTAIPAAT